MRIFALILCLFAPLRALAAESGPLLVLTEPTARGYLGTLLDKWRLGVLHESNWTEVIIIELPRWTGTYVTNDWPGLLRMSNVVAFYKPSAVQIIGRLPPYMSGGHTADGHELRRTVNDHWLGCTTNLTVTDTANWGMPGTVGGQPSVLGTNVPGDGIPDEIYGTFSIPVCRLDASGLTSVAGNFAAGYLAGQPYQPAIDEAYWLRCYMTNNLAFRAKQWAVTETGVIANDCCWFNAATITVTNKAVTWSTTNNIDMGGGTWRWTYDSVQLSDISPYFITAGGTPLRTFFDVNYKSYGMEIAAGQGSYIRRLFPGSINQPFALVSGWCIGAAGPNAYWIGTVADKTVADSIRSSVDRYAAGGTKLYLFYAWLAGDLTLPIDAIVQDPPFVTTVGDLPVGTVAP